MRSGDCHLSVGISPLLLTATPRFGAVSSSSSEVLSRKTTSADSGIASQVFYSWFMGRLGFLHWKRSCGDSAPKSRKLNALPGLLVLQSYGRIQRVSGHHTTAPLLRTPLHHATPLLRAHCYRRKHPTTGDHFHGSVLYCFMERSRQTNHLPLLSRCRMVKSSPG